MAKPSNLVLAVVPPIRYKIIYALHCTECNTYYVGRYVRQLQEKIGENRRNFYNHKVVENVSTILANNLNRDDDEFSPGLHLIDEHPYITYNKTAFNTIYKTFILDVCSLRVLEVTEHKYIHHLKTLNKPYGMNLLHL